MSIHCTAGEEPWVYYRFGGGAWQKIQIKAAPIEVLVQPESAQILYKVNISPSQNLILPPNEKRLSFSTLKNPNGILIAWRKEDKSWGWCYSTFIKEYLPGYKRQIEIYSFSGSGYVEIAENFPAGGDELKINYQGSLMFSKSGKSPCEFKVACGCGECPPGFMKCSRPGSYYCMPVSEIKPNLVYIQSLLRNKNG